MRKMQRHLKALADELSANEILDVAKTMCADEAAEAESRKNELLLAKKQLEIIIAFTSCASKHSVSSSSFARSVATEMHRMTLPPLVEPHSILPGCMLLAHYKCTLEDAGHGDFWKLCTVGELHKYVLPKGETPEEVIADIIGDKIAQYTKGKADVASLYAWLEDKGWSKNLPEALEKQVLALWRVVGLARSMGNAGDAYSDIENLSDAEIQASIDIVSSSKNPIASTLLLYPQDRSILEGAKDEQKARLASMGVAPIGAQCARQQYLGFIREAAEGPLSVSCST